MRAFSLALIAVLLIFCNSVLAEWENFGLKGITILCLTVHPTADSIIYAGTNNNGFYFTENGGLNWINSLEGHMVVYIAVNRMNPQIVAALTSKGIFQSRNGGRTFSEINISGYGIPKCIAWDETQTKGTFLGTDSGILKSFDLGKTWQAAGLQENEITSITLDNSGPKPIIYAGSSTGGVYKTANLGLSWTSQNNGLDNPAIFNVLCDRIAPKTLFAATLESGVFISKDGATNWEMTAIELKSLAGFSIGQAVDPISNKSIIYISNFAGEIFKTEDAIKYERIGEFNQKPVLCFGVSNVLPSRLYYGTIDGIYSFQEK